ncbi:MAG: OmcA/MtrC family decaheme c-type cytochrome [Thermoanaerobaculia bacterium]|nr:OmcA/MtrC family decaheme c-type cytochrome [Thermoanaerobaculia bacterium]
MIVAAAATLAVTSSGPLTAVDGNASRRRPVVAQTTPTQPTTSAFTPAQMEYYLGEDGVAYIRPGLKIKINSVTIGSDRRAVVDFNLTDDFDQPLDRAGKITPGVVSTSWIFAYYSPDTREYTAYTTRTATGVATSPNPGATAIQASSDSPAGPYVELEMGHYTYKFTKVLPENYDKAKTHTIGIYATRNLTEILGKNYYANVEHDFRPDGGTITAKWDKIRDGACLNCHDPLALHGGSRRDVKLCVMCHSTQTKDPDTGNSVNMAELVHKIHYPAGQTTPYIIWGNQSSIHNYSHTTYPQSVLNCANCHEGRTAAQKPTQSDIWYTQPSRRACGACHGATDFAGGSNHPKQTSDTQCATCHIPESGVEFDASIKGAHTIASKSKQLKGVKVSIVSVTGVAPGSKPTVTYKITQGDGTTVIDGNKLSTFSPILAGPTTSYVDYWRENAIGKGVFDAAAGTTTYTFTNAIPATGKGTWVISGDFYLNTAVKRGDGGADITVRDAAVNPIKYVSTTSAPAVARRQIVDINLCNECHDSLALHGGQRLVIDECVICHNPVEDDQSRRPAAAGAPESVSFQRMIHRIHSGEELTQPYTVYGFGGTPFDFTEVLYPGDRRNCLSCHISGTQNVPPAVGADPVVTLRDFFSPQGPGTASCLGCHDNEDAAAHAFLNTTNFPGSTKPSEACGTCHGAGAEWSVDKSHAR